MQSSSIALRPNIRKRLSNQAKTTSAKVTGRRPPRSVGTFADANSCNSGVELRSLRKVPRSAIPEKRKLWDGNERRTQDFAVEKERRSCYLIDTPDFRAQAEKARKTIMDHATDLKDAPFPEAALRWLEQKQMYNRDTTLNCYRDYLKRLVTYFTMPLKDIHIGHIMEYQARMKKKYHPESVNHDINMLSQIMKRADLWAAIKEHYRPLPKPETDPPKVLSDYEETRFFEFASKNEGTWLAYWVASLTNNTTASGKELRMLQLKDIDIESDPPLFRVPKNMKNLNRPRTIPLNERGAEIMRRMLRRAHSLGSTQPHHYLFPFRHKNRRFEPTRPATQSWLKWQWNHLIDAAMEAKVISFRIKPHNLRHQAITKLLDNGVPIETVRELAGHGVDSVVTRHYYHGRVERLKSAVDLISPPKPKPSNVVNFKAKGAGHAS